MVPSVGVSAYLATVLGWTIFHSTIWLSETTPLRRSAKKCTLQVLILYWPASDTASDVACTPSIWDLSSRFSKLLRSSSQALLQLASHGILDLARNEVSQHLCCFPIAHRHSFCRQGLGVEEQFLLWNVSKVFWMPRYWGPNADSSGRIRFWMLSGPFWCSWTVHFWRW